MSELDERVDIVLNQTNYTRTEAEQQLALHKNDEVEVIRRYLRGSSDITDNANPQHQHLHQQQQQLASKNQLVYSEIRKFMDACVQQHPIDSSALQK
jgi:hypothetical protein